MRPTAPPRGRTLRWLCGSGLAASVVFMTLGSLVLPSPFASAQLAGDSSFTRDEQVPRGTPCPAATTAIGDLQFDDFGPVIDSTYCRPGGFTPVTDQELCALALTLLSGELIVFFPQMPLCAIDGVPIGPGLSCGPLVRAVGPGFFGEQEIGFGGCLAPLLTDAAGLGSAGTPVCIESDVVQRSKAAASSSVGGTFQDGAVRYLIATGAPTCQFHCADGFDANCDGRLSDFCPTGLDLRLVRDVGTCLAALALATAVTPPTQPVTLAAAVPVQAAPLAPLAVAVPQIAHTGAETAVLAFVGTGLVSLGAVSLGLRRRLDGV